MALSFLQSSISVWIAFEILAYLPQPQGAKCTKTHTSIILSFSMSIPFIFILPWGGKTNPLLVANEPSQKMRGQKWPHVSCNSLLLFGLLLKSLVSNSTWHTRPSWLIRRCLETSCDHKSHTNHIQAPLLCERKKVNIKTCSRSRPFNLHLDFWKSMFVSNLRKISGHAHLDFFSVCRTWRFKAEL
jgi:hypothetical protein